MTLLSPLSLLSPSSLARIFRPRDWTLVSPALGLALALALILAPRPAFASEESSHEHRLGYGLAIGYGYGVAPRDNQRGSDVQDVRTLAIEPSLRMPLHTFGEGEAWYDGRLDGLLQATVLVELDPGSGTAAAGSLGLRYLFSPNWKTRPYIEGSLGVGDLAFGLTGQDDGVSFFIHTALGVRHPISDDFSLIASVLWQHVSNANSHPPNLGIDTVGFRIGLELW